MEEVNKCRLTPHVKRFAIALLILSATLLPCVAEDVSTDTAPIEADVVSMLSAMRGKFSLPQHEYRIAQHGDAAVPILIRKYSEVPEDKRWALVACLCRLPTDESRKFLMTVLREHADRKTTSDLILLYPIQHEADITGILIELLPHHGYYASWRLRDMIFRDPSIAGKLVDSLVDEASAKTRNRELYGTLEHVSGYAGTTPYVRELAGEPVPYSDNKFWRAWWQRNNRKDVFEWLHEALYLKHGGMRSYVLGVLGHLDDRRAIPVFIEALDDKEYGVRYSAVWNLRKFDWSYPSDSYLPETFKGEERDIIAKLKVRFGKKTDNTRLTGVTAQAQDMEVDKLFDLRRPDTNQPYYLERISVDPGHTFEKDPWLEVAKQIVKIDDFIKIDDFKDFDYFKDVDGTEGLYSALSVGRYWARDILSTIFASKLQKPVRRIHKMNPNKENDFDFIISELSSPVPMEFRQTRYVWVLSIKLSSPLGKEAVTYLKRILLPNSKARDGYSYFRGSEEVWANLKECVFWEDGETFFLSGSKVGLYPSRGHSLLHWDQFWFSPR